MKKYVIVNPFGHPVLYTYSLFIKWKSLIEIKNIFCTECTLPFAFDSWDKFQHPVNS